MEITTMKVYIIIIYMPYVIYIQMPWPIAQTIICINIIVISIKLDVKMLTPFLCIGLEAIYFLFEEFEGLLKK